jgi:hypothetical protein
MGGELPGRTHADETQRNIHMHCLARTIVLLVLFTVSTVANGFAPISGSQLLEHCRAYVDEPESSSGVLCAAYVSGFVEGTGALASRQVMSGDRSTESFAHRALRTRLGLPRRCEPAYCLESEVSLQQFIADVLAYAKRNPPESTTSANDVVAATLRSFHACAPTRTHGR